MKFRLDRVRSLATDKEKKVLEELGFKFEGYGDEDYLGDDRWRSDSDNPPWIEINTLGELLELYDKAQSDLIITRNTITIYDGYIE